MFEGITGEILFNDPHILAKYLDDISNEAEVPYPQRDEDLMADPIRMGLTEEVAKKQSQLKLLVDFVGILMDRSQEKIQQQVDMIEKLEHESREMLEENSSIKLELDIMKQNFDSFQEKYRKMEANCQELEEKYDKERMACNRGQMQVHALSSIADKYEEAETTGRRMTVANSQLSQEKLVMEARLNNEREENQKLKEELKLKELDIVSITRSFEEVTKVKNLYEVQAKDYESEREACICEIQNLRIQIEELTSKYESCEHELTMVRHASCHTTSIRDEIPENVLNNLNAKICQAISNQPLRRVRSKSNGKDSLDSFSANVYNDDGIPENFINVDDLQVEQYDGMRFSINHQASREFPSYSAARKSKFVQETTSPIQPNNHVKDQFSWDSNASTEVPGKTEKPVTETTEATTADSVSKTTPEANTANAAARVSSSPSKDKQKLAFETGKRREILEEFYQLTWQSVLMNSPNFNEIAGWVDSTNIYEEIKKTGIPFFQWYNWLSVRLEEVYKSHLLPEIRERRATTIRRRQTKV